MGNQKTKPQAKAKQTEPTQSAVGVSTGNNSSKNGGDRGGRWFARGGQRFDETAEYGRFLPGFDGILVSVMKHQGEMMGASSADYVAWLAGFTNAWHCAICKERREFEKNQHHSV